MSFFSCDGKPGRDQELIRALCSWPLERLLKKGPGEPCTWFVCVCAHRMRHTSGPVLSQ
jgi:hypothetical protein